MQMSHHVQNNDTKDESISLWEKQCKKETSEEKRKGHKTSNITSLCVLGSVFSQNIHSPESNSKPLLCFALGIGVLSFTSDMPFLEVHYIRIYMQQ